MSLLLVLAHEELRTFLLFCCRCLMKNLVHYLQAIETKMLLELILKIISNLEFTHIISNCTYCLHVLRTPFSCPCAHRCLHTVRTDCMLYTNLHRRIFMAWMAHLDSHILEPMFTCYFNVWCQLPRCVQMVR